MPSGQLPHESGQEPSRRTLGVAEVGTGVTPEDVPVPRDPAVVAVITRPAVRAPAVNVDLPSEPPQSLPGRGGMGTAYGPLASVNLPQFERVGFVIPRSGPDQLSGPHA